MLTWITFCKFLVSFDNFLKLLITFITFKGFAVLVSKLFRIMLNNNVIIGGFGWHFFPLSCAKGAADCFLFSGLLSL